MPDQDDEQRKKDLAAALQRLAGEPPPATGQRDTQRDTSGQRPSTPSRPAAPRLGSQRPTAPGRGAGSAPPRPVAPPPQLHRRPVVPTTRSASAPFDDAAAPIATPPIDDDDAVIVPAPNPDVFLPKHRPAPRPRSHLLGSLRLRRTLIPILLTSGLMLPTLGIMWFLTDEESPFRKPGLGVPVTLITVGAVLFVLGLINAFHVRHQLQHLRQTGAV